MVSAPVCAVLTACSPAASATGSPGDEGPAGPAGTLVGQTVPLLPCLGHPAAVQLRRDPAGLPGDIVFPPRCRYVTQSRSRQRSGVTSSSVVYL